MQIARLRILAGLRFDLWLSAYSMSITMLKNHWNALTFVTFVKLRNHCATLSPKNLENTSNIKDWGLTLDT